jgi:hypothetical protein
VLKLRCDETRVADSSLACLRNGTLRMVDWDGRERGRTRVRRGTSLARMQKGRAVLERRVGHWEHGEVVEVRELDPLSLKSVAVARVRRPGVFAVECGPWPASLDLGHHYLSPERTLLKIYGTKGVPTQRVSFGGGWIEGLAAMDEKRAVVFGALSHGTGFLATVSLTEGRILAFARLPMRLRNVVSGGHSLFAADGGALYEIASDLTTADLVVDGPVWPDHAARDGVAGLRAGRGHTVFSRR